MKFSIVCLSLLAGSLALGGPPADKHAGKDKSHHVSGYGFNDVGFAAWSHTYAVIQRADGSVSGMVKCHVIEYATEDTPEIVFNYTVEVECVEIDLETKTAWLGGRLVQTDIPDFLPLGLYMVVYAHDGGPGGLNDTHGDNVPSWLGLPDTCAGRIAPLFEDPVEKGNIVVK